MDTVSGWRRMAAHPPATAGGTDCVQVTRPSNFVTRPSNFGGRKGAVRYARAGALRAVLGSLLDTVSTTRGSGWVRSHFKFDYLYEKNRSHPW